MLRGIDILKLGKSRLGLTIDGRLAPRQALRGPKLSGDD